MAVSELYAVDLDASPTDGVPTRVVVRYHRVGADPLIISMTPQGHPRPDCVELPQLGERHEFSVALHGSGAVAVHFDLGGSTRSKQVTLRPAPPATPSKPRGRS